MPCRRTRWFLAGCLALGAAGLPACAAPGEPAARPEAGAPRTVPGTQSRVPGEYLVTVRPGGDEALIRQLYAAYSVREVRSLGGDRFLVRLGRDPGPEAVRQAALASDGISDVQPNFVYRVGPPGDRVLERLERRK